MLTSGPPSHRALAYQRGSQGNVGDAFGRVDMIEQPGGVADRSCQPRSNYFFNDDRKPHPAAFFLLTRRKDETDIAGAPQADFGARVVGTFRKSSEERRVGKGCVSTGSFRGW